LIFRAFENQENRNAQILSTAIANEGDAGKTYDNYFEYFLRGLKDSYDSGI
tara:strand:+ start:219 stop:371 length:153 start_codon:yes stop_codon:yes gene_type:complete